MSFSYLIRDLWKKQDDSAKSLTPLGEYFSIDRTLIFLPDVDWYLEHYKENLAIGITATHSWNNLGRALEDAIYYYYCDKRKILPAPYPRFDEFIDYILESGNVYFRQCFCDGKLDRMIRGVRCTLPDGFDSLEWDLVDKLEAIAEKFHFYLF